MHREILSKKENFTSKPSLFARKKSWNRNKLSNTKNFAKIDDSRYCSQSQKVLGPKTLEEEEHILAFIFISVCFKSFGAFSGKQRSSLFLSQRGLSMAIIDKHGQINKDGQGGTTSHKTGKS